MSVRIESSRALARQVQAAVELPRGWTITEVREFASAFSAPCDATELLAWMGWMSAGPPTLAAEVLRSAGAWAWVRYRWALEDHRGFVRPTVEARSIRQHTRSTFSEAIGIGAAGLLGCTGLVPSGFLTVVNLDDVIEPLLRDGVIRRRHGYGRKQPDYLIVRDSGGPFLELFAIECKGTVKRTKTAVGQLAAGVRQVLGIESDLPMRRLVFATSLDLDDPEPTVRTQVVEIVKRRRTGGRREPDLGLIRESVRDAALVRALRCAGLYEVADRARQGYVPEQIEIPANLRIADRPMVGRVVELGSRGRGLRAEIGIDLETLLALAAPGPERRTRLERQEAEIGDGREGRRRRIETPTHTLEETLMGDGIGVLFEERAEEPRYEQAS